RCGSSTRVEAKPQREGAALGLPQGRLPSLVRVIESRTA
ncbi:class I SAM-dependent methyltransferase, partial [Pseudomonas aeruginosa]|nr:class I SAM-dependent methyltransferase [Pseudomonas aeruginosa]